MNEKSMNTWVYQDHIVLNKEHLIKQQKELAVIPWGFQV